MKTKFKDVAHLYTGCEVFHYNNGTSFKPIQSSIFYADSNGNIELNNRRKIEPSQQHLLKPILRPMSDITQDEMKELYAIVFGKNFCGDNITHRDIGKKQERWVLWSGVERLFIYKDGDIGADSDLHYYTVHQPTVIVWLLSKQFDLFKLIENGIAIDKTVLAVAGSDLKPISSGGILP